MVRAVPRYCGSPSSVTQAENCAESAITVAPQMAATVSKSADTTSGNTPKGAYQNCVALESNPVYRGNQCDDLRGPNNALLYGGIAAAAAGISLMLMGSSISAIEIGPRAVRFRHHVKF